MIEKNILQLSTDHAGQLAKMGIYAQPRAGTPLAELVSYCRSDMDIMSVTADHDAFAEGLADNLADAMRGYLNFARNAAKPALADLQEKVKDAILSVTFDPFAGLNIVSVGAPEVLESGDFLQLISHYNSGSVKVPLLRARFGARTDAQLLEALATGNKVWDDQITAWLAALPEGHLQTVWQSVFMDVNAPKTAPIVTVEGLLEDFISGNFSALIIFLLAYRFNKDIDDEIGLSLDQARSYLYDLLQVSATNVERGINWFNSFVGTNSLVVKNDQAGRKITVNGPVYKQFLKEGGKADVLMGLLVSDKRYTTVAEIQAHAEELMNTWGMYAQSRDFEAQAAYESQTRSAMLLLFEQSLETPYGEIDQAELAKPGAKNTVMTRFKTLLSEYTREQIHKNWIDVLWRCACQARFYYNTTAYELLDAIDYAVREKGAEPEDAATQAVEKVLSQFVAEMIQATKAS